MNRLYDLWEAPDANGVRGILALAAQEPEFQQVEGQHSQREGHTGEDRQPPVAAKQAACLSA